MPIGPNKERSRRAVSGPPASPGSIPCMPSACLLSVGMLMQEVQAHTRLDFGLGVILTPLLLQGWHPLLTNFWNTPAWTMSTEAFFYLLFPWLITRRRPRQARTILLDSVCRMALRAWCFPRSTCTSIRMVMLHPDRYSVGIWMRALKFMPLQHLPSFLFGMALGFLNEKIRPESRKRLAVGLHCFCRALPDSLRGRPPALRDDARWSADAAVRRSDPVPGRAQSIARFFGLLPFIAIGEASYCLYLLHFNLWTLLHDSHFLEKSGLIVFDPWISYLLLIVAALLTKRLIERPGRSWIVRRLPSGAARA